MAQPDALNKVKHYMATVPADSLRSTIYADTTIKKVSVHKTFFQKALHGVKRNSSATVLVTAGLIL